MAILAAYGIAGLPRLWARLLGALLLGHLIAASLVVSFVPERTPVLVVAGRQVPLLAQPRPPGSPEAQAWRRERIVKTLSQHARGAAAQVLVTNARTPLTHGDFQFFANRERIPLHFLPLPFWFPEGHTRSRPIDLKRLEGASYWVVRGAPYADRYPSDQPRLLHWCSTFSEAALDPGGELAPHLEELERFRLPDGALVFLYRVEKTAALRRDLARLVLRQQPGHPGAIARLGSEAAPGPAVTSRSVGGDAKRLALERLREGLQVGPAGGPQGERERWSSLLESARERAEASRHWLALAGRLPPEDPAFWTLLRRAAESAGADASTISKLLSEPAPKTLEALWQDLRQREARAYGLRAR